MTVKVLRRKWQNEAQISECILGRSKLFFLSPREANEFETLLDSFKKKLTD